MDFSKLMDMANQIKSQLSAAQEKAAAAQVTGEAGAGLVRVVMNGQYEVLEVHIDPKAVSSAMGDDDLRLLEDLIRAAVNQATVGVGQSLRERLGSMAQGFGIDPSALESFMNESK